MIVNPLHPRLPAGREPRVKDDWPLCPPPISFRSPRLVARRLSSTASIDCRSISWSSCAPGGPAKLGAGPIPTSRLTSDQDEISGLAVALTQIARLTRNLESRKTIRHSTATDPTSRSAAAPTRYSSATSPWRAKRQQVTTEFPPRTSISTRSTIFASITRAAKAISRGRRRGRPHWPTSR
jgi:hypothetical protein